MTHLKPAPYEYSQRLNPSELERFTGNNFSNLSGSVTITENQLMNHLRESETNAVLSKPGVCISAMSSIKKHTFALSDPR